MENPTSEENIVTPNLIWGAEKDKKSASHLLLK
ncbi:MAG: hypothetical protein RIR73_2610 [Chloroflexota bacterium]|jgi:hypothetical protein